MGSFLQEFSLPSSRWRRHSKYHPGICSYYSIQQTRDWCLLWYASLYIEKIPKKESVIVMWDLNAKVGADHNAWTPTMGKYGLGKANSRGDKLLEFCTLHKLAVCNTYFQHKECRRATWTSPDGHYRNQIDYIITQVDNLSTFQNCRSYCSADIGSYHNLVLAKVKQS